MTEKRKQLYMALLPALICLISVIGLSVFWMREYRQAVFVHISELCENLAEDNPEEERRVFLALKTYHRLADSERKNGEFLAQYGYQSSEFCTGISWRFLFPSAASVLAVAFATLFSAQYGNRRKKRRIEELTIYLEQVNTSAGGTILWTKEDEFSHLQDEIYKTVTSLYQTREAAVAAKHNFADHLANIAHQLKTPITAAFLSLQLGRETQASYREQIEKQLERLYRLEESLLMLSKIDTGALQMEYKQVDVYTVLNLAAENLNDLLAAADISVDIPDHGCVEFYGDMEWTMEALLNLMKNCMEHSKPGGTIHCEYAVNPLYTEIFIWDDGTGFPAEDLPHLFERFYRGKEAKGTGAGIGLSIAKAVFELQNGSIAARNLPEGGACFEIKLYSKRI